MVVYNLGSPQPGATVTGFCGLMPQFSKSVFATVLLFGPSGLYATPSPSIRTSSDSKHVYFPFAALPLRTVIEGAPGSQSTVPAVYGPKLPLMEPYCGSPPGPPGPPL